MERARRPVKVCIVYEHALFAHGVKGLLERDPGLRIVAMLERPAAALATLGRQKPEVVIIEGNGGMAILESLDGAIGVAISLRGVDATIFTGVPIRVSGPAELAGAIRSIGGRHRRRRRRRVAS